MSKEFEMFQKRLTQRGKTAVDRAETDKLRTFKQVLDSAYNSEWIEKDGKLHKALLGNYRLKMDYDEKTLSTLNDWGYRIGDTIYWPRTDSYWIVMTEHLTERAYFKGDIRRAHHLIRWRDARGIVREAWAALRGPKETVIKEEIKKHLMYDVPNNSLTLWFGASEGAESLRRYSHIMIAGKTWRINIVDNMVAPGLIKMRLTEAAFDKEQDNLDLQIARDTDVFEIRCQLDRVNHVPLGQPIEANFEVFRNGELVANLENEIEVEMSDGDSFSGHYDIRPHFIFLTEGEKEIRVSIPSMKIEKTYTITVEKMDTEVISYTISGNEVIRPFGEMTYEYSVIKTANGVRQDNSNNGTWELRGAAIAEIVSSTTNAVSIAFSGNVGKLELVYIVDGEEKAIKNIEVYSMFR